MTTAAAQRAARARLIRAGAYDPAHERSACGLGLIASRSGGPRRDVVELALAGMKSLGHRGAVAADGKTGDGAGLAVEIPQAFMRDEVARTGHTPADGPVGAGMVFLPRRDFAAQEAARAIVETEILRAGLYLYGWRQVPTHPDVLGDRAAETRPEIEQVLFHDPLERPPAVLERRLFLARRRIERAARAQDGLDLYVCSLSAWTIVYKGMFRAEQIDQYYPDLGREDFRSRAAILHQRYSTNTFPEWRLAQPFRVLAHNGEINTLKGNVNWMGSHEIGLAADAFGDDAPDVRPIIQPGSSDSAALDQAFEAILRSGRDAPLAKALLIPAAPGMRPPTDDAGRRRRELFEYCASVMEPWDGPAAVAALDGSWAVAGLDRNGLRPARWAITGDDLLVVGSECGLCDLDPARVARRGAIAPGGLIGVHLDDGAIYVDDALLDHVAERAPYGEWARRVVDVEPEIGPGPEAPLYDAAERRRRMRAAGLTREDVELVVRPMAETGKEAIGSMGDDTPLAVLSKRGRPLSHFFRQNFSQVTNPPIDPLREARVMSLKTRLRNLGALRGHDGPSSAILRMDGPILTNGMTDRLVARLEGETAVIDCTAPAAAITGSGAALRDALQRIAEDAHRAAQGGEVHLILTDEAQSADTVGLPMILAAAAVHRRLLADGERRNSAITVRAADCVDAHGAAVLIGVGATCVNPYLAMDAATDLAARDLVERADGEAAAGNLKAALEAGILKILSKMGIAVISSYRGGCNFELLGLSRALAAEFFPGVPSRISGIGLAGLETQMLRRHRAAWDGPDQLAIGGFYTQRAAGEAHALEAEVVSALQKAVRDDDADAFTDFREALAAQPPIQLRDLLTLRTAAESAPLSRVEPAHRIRRRFLTPGMSLGALSPEAHATLNIAMNEMGARSVSGEGGEDPAHYAPDADGVNRNSAVKQVASGRFGVTAAYLNACDEIEIKIAQGAKPGEGGQLPGFKVTDFIARMRHATPGVTLISPPPHHDIYSIEDLAQLIYDLKQINPRARVCVKLVAAAGVGPIAAGVAKANADVILISGHVGGTGASPLTSIKFAGAPWELGLAEAHQILTLNGLRDAVRLRTDGGLRTGRDIVTAAMLGAEEFGIGTASLVAMGCLMVRQCHSNTCPVGVCTQDPDLRARFRGAPDHVIAFMTFLAEDVRRVLSQIGCTRLDDVVGRSDLLTQVSRGAAHLDDLDLNPLLVQVDPDWRAQPYGRARAPRPAPDTLDVQILAEAGDRLDQGERIELDLEIRNTDRAVGARLSQRLIAAHPPDGPRTTRATVRLHGAAGQSFGAFAARGLRLILEGEANDYVGKGLSGGEVVVRPDRRGRRGRGPTGGEVILGNTCLYGATSGALFAAGRAGERFAVRNSGADAVIEGAGANACEYMTGGVVMILGDVGENFGAGMTGGEVFVYDREGRLADVANTETIRLDPLDDPAAADRALALLRRHARATRSRLARALAEDWAESRGGFVHATPREAAARAALGLAA